MIPSKSLTLLPPPKIEGVPTKGTVLLIKDYSETISVILAMPWQRVIAIVQCEMEKRRGWTTSLLKLFVKITPTCPVPKRKLSLPIVKVEPNTHTITWTHNGWHNYDGRIWRPYINKWDGIGDSEE
jgi:hypothetical protein